MTRSVPRAARAALLSLPLLAACGGSRTLVQQPTLERPVAVAFACTGADDQIVDVSRCAGGGGRLWALVANSTRGEVAVAEVSTVGVRRRIRDLDPVSPGYQMLSVGREIADIAVSPATVDGRPAPVIAVTSNAGSCDYGLIDVQDLITGEDPVANTVTPTLGSSPLSVRPHAVAFVPGKASEIYATLPGCGLLARIDLDTGAVIESLRFLADGTARPEAAPICPVECGPGKDPCAGGACPATAAPTDLDVADDASLLVVSAGQGRVVAVALAADGAFGAARSVLLESAPATGRVRVSPATGLGRFAYVAASDGSVRVVSLSEFRECETNSAPEADAALTASGCAPLGTPRRLLSRGPGIDLARNGPQNVVLPVDIAFSTSCDPSCFSRGAGDPVPLPCDAPLGDPGAAAYYDGVFAHVLGSDGQVVAVDVQDCAYSDAVPHSIRSALSRVEEADGFRRATPLVGEFDSDGNAVAEVPGRALGGEQGPDSLYPVLQPTTTDSHDVGVHFPEPLRTPSDRVALTFEGVLPLTRRGQGQLSPCGENVCLRDPGAAFCSRGVEAGDILEIVSCTSDAQCRAVERCYRDPSATIEQGGMCVCDEDADPVADRCMDPNDRDCKPLLIARREYAIVAARAGELELSTDAPAPPGCHPSSPSCPSDEPTCCPDAPLRAPLVAACFPSPTRYQVRARNALVLQSSAVETVHRIVVDAAGNCVADAARSPLLQSKFSLDPPDCVDSAVPDPNPCRTRDLVRARHPLYDLTIARADDAPPRGPGVEFVISFSVAGSLSRFAVDSAAFLPAALDLAPDGFLYVVDQGDAIGSNVRGQVRRMLPSDVKVQEESDFVLF